MRRPVRCGEMSRASRRRARRWGSRGPSWVKRTSTTVPTWCPRLSVTGAPRMSLILMVRSGDLVDDVVVGPVLQAGEVEAVAGGVDLEGGPEDGDVPVVDAGGL